MLQNAINKKSRGKPRFMTQLYEMCAWLTQRFFSYRFVDTNTSSTQVDAFVYKKLFIVS